jgi:hypothetical protein
MAFFRGPNVVTNGLVLALDAANPKSYISGSTTWNDLSGNGNSGSLVNGPIFNSANGGNIIFDGTNDYIQCSGSPTVTSATFLCWIRRNGNQGTYDGIIFSRGTSVTGMAFFSSDQLGYTWNNATNTYNWVSGLTIPDLTWCMVAVSVTPTSATAYLCQSSGITSATNTVSHTSTILDDIKIGVDEVFSRYFAGNIAIAQIYNRALSSQEVLQNYNGQKSRFNL